MANGTLELDHALLIGGGVVSRKGNPALASAIDWAVRQCRLVSILPGVYARPDQLHEFEVLVRGLMLWDRDAVLMGATAAKLTFWRELRAPVVEAVAERDPRRDGFRVRRKKIPSDLVVEVGGLRLTTPALTALDLSSVLGGNAIDTVLRMRAATLDQLHEALALTPTRRGNTDRRVLLLDSRDKPWSEAERALHRILREAGITGWKGNWGLETSTGVYWIDVAFAKPKLAIEVDGWEFHNSRQAFESDRARQNDLVVAGWRVLRFTARMIQDHPLVVLATIRTALAG